MMKEKSPVFPQREAVQKLHDCGVSFAELCLKTQGNISGVMAGYHIKADGEFQPAFVATPHMFQMKGEKEPSKKTVIGRFAGVLDKTKSNVAAYITEVWYKSCKKGQKLEKNKSVREMEGSKEAVSIQTICADYVIMTMVPFDKDEKTGKISIDESSKWTNTVVFAEKGEKEVKSWMIDVIRMAVARPLSDLLM